MHFKQLIIFAWFVLLAACQTPNNLKKPDVTLASVQMAKAGLLEQQWQVALRVTNPNDSKITLKAVDYALFLDNIKFATGMNQEAVSVAARGNELITTTITTNLLSTLKQLSTVALKDDGKVPYRVTGTARIGGWPLPVQFDHKGDVDLPLMR